MSRKEIDEFIINLARVHPEYTIQTFKVEFKDAISRNPTIPEITSFLKFAKEEDVNSSLDSSFNSSSSSFNPSSSSFNPSSSSFNPSTSSFNPSTSSFNPSTSSFNPSTSSFNPTTSSFNPSTSSFNPSSSSSFASGKTSGIRGLKRKCINPNNTGKGVFWLDELPTLIDRLVQESSSLDNDSEEITTVLDILNLLGYSYRLEHTGILQNKLDEIDGFNRLLSFFWSSDSATLKSETAKILAFFYHNRPLPSSTHVIIPILVQNLYSCYDKVSASSSLFPSYKRLLDALRCLCYTKNSATLLIDGDILPAAVGLLGLPSVPIANAAADLLSQVSLFSVNSATHVQKIVNAGLFPPMVKAISFVWSKDANLLNHVVLVQAILRGGEIAVEAAVAAGLVGQYLNILREYANGRLHSINDPDIIFFLVKSLLKISYAGLLKVERIGRAGENAYKKEFEKGSGLSILMSLYYLTNPTGLQQAKNIVPLCVGCLLKGEIPKPAEEFGPLLAALKEKQTGGGYEKDGYSYEKIWNGLVEADTVLEDWEKIKK